MLVRLMQVSDPRADEIEEVMVNTSYIIHASACVKDTSRTEIVVDQRGNAVAVWIAMPYHEFAMLIDQWQGKEHP